MKGYTRNKNPFQELRRKKHRIPETSIVKRYGWGLVYFYISFIVITYVLTFFGAGSIVDESSPSAILEQTFPIFFAISLLLSALLFLVKSNFATLMIILFRFYLIAIQGYGVGSFFFLKLLLGFGLLFEAVFFFQSPYNLISAFPLIVGLLAVQMYNPFLGHYARESREIFASWQKLTALAFVWGLCAVLLGFVTEMAQNSEEYKRHFSIQNKGMQLLTDLNIDLQSYARKIDHESSERERNRISRELHDISGYIFTNLIVMLDAACSIPPENFNELSDLLISARKEARQGLEETRSALQKKRAVQFPEDEGLRAINKIITNFQNVTGIRVDVSWGNAPSTFSPEINFILYRTVQEALTNAFKHGLATEVSIDFLIREGTLRVSISDNGKGANQVVKGIGLTGMDERIGALGGSVQAFANSGKGFTLLAQIPLERKESPNPDEKVGIIKT